MKLTPTASMRTSTSPSRGVGRSTSTYSSTSGPPVLEMRIAWLIFSLSRAKSRDHRSNRYESSLTARRFTDAQSPCRTKLSLHFGDALLIAFVERVLLDPLCAYQAGVRENSQMLARRRLADAELFGDENAADFSLSRAKSRDHRSNRHESSFTAR